jgi:hypothetical protein
MRGCLCVRSSAGLAEAGAYVGGRQCSEVTETVQTQPLQNGNEVGFVERRHREWSQERRGRAGCASRASNAIPADPARHFTGIGEARAKVSSEQSNAAITHRRTRSPMSRSTREHVPRMRMRTGSNERAREPMRHAPPSR